MDDRAEAIDILTRMSTNHFYGHREQEAFKLGAEALSAERRGRWIFKEDRRIVDGYDWQCSQCNSWQRYTSNYCPNCGSFNGKENLNEKL